MVGIILLYHLAHELERKMSGTRKTSMVRRELINLTDMGRTIRNRNLAMGGSQDGLEGDQEGKTVQQEKHQDDIHPIAAFHPKIGMVSGGTVWWISTPLFKRLNNLY